MNTSRILKMTLSVIMPVLLLGIEGQRKSLRTDGFSHAHGDWMTDRLQSKCMEHRFAIRMIVGNGS